MSNKMSYYDVVAIFFDEPYKDSDADGVLESIDLRCVVNRNVIYWEKT